MITLYEYLEEWEKFLPDRSVHPRDPYDFEGAISHFYGIMGYIEETSAAIAKLLYIIIALLAVIIILQLISLIKRYKKQAKQNKPEVEQGQNTDEVSS